MRDQPKQGCFPVIVPGRNDSCEQHDAEESSYALLFDRVFDRVRRLEDLLSREREGAPALLQELLPHPPARRLLMVRNSCRFATVGLCEVVLDTSWESRFEAPEETLSWAELATAITERLQELTYDRRMLEDLRGRAWIHVANARRCLADFNGAAEALRVADSHLQDGSGDALERGFWLRIKANLLGARKQVTEADALLDQAVSLYQEHGFEHELGMTLMARSHLYRDDSEKEIRYLDKAFPLLDLSREPRAKLVAVHNLALALHDLGRNPEALALLVRWRFLYFEFGDRAFLLHLHWLEGIVARDMGRPEMAEGALEEARKGFLRLSLPYQAALVALDLSELYLKIGRSREVLELATEIHAFFRSRQIGREAIAALLLFREAAQEERATVDLVHRLADFLHRVQENPEARFERP